MRPDTLAARRAERSSRVAALRDGRRQRAATVQPKRGRGAPYRRTKKHRKETEQ